MPISELREKVGNRQKQRDTELQMWKDWKASGENPDLLEPLLVAYQPAIQSKVNEFAGQVPIPPAAIRAEAEKRTLDAFRDYDPDYVGEKSGKTAQLHTHVFNRLRKVRRFIVKYQNVGTMPEKRAEKITDYRMAFAELSEDKGREPSELELAEKLQWAPAEVGRMQSEQRKDLLSSGFDTLSVDPSFTMPSRDREIVQLLKYEISPRENLVLEYSMGMNGKQQMGTTEIAAKLGVSPPVVSRIKTKLAKKIEEYGGGF